MFNSTLEGFFVEVDWVLRQAQDDRIVEVDCVRCLQHDKIKGKIEEVDYDIPANVGMRNYTQKNL